MPRLQNKMHVNIGKTSRSGRRIDSAWVCSTEFGHLMRVAEYVWVSGNKQLSQLRPFGYGFSGSGVAS